MKILLSSLLLFLSFSVFAQKSLTVNDRQEDVLAILEQFKEIDLPLSMPLSIPLDLGFNNGNNRLSPGEIAILDIQHSTSNPLSCFVKYHKKNTSKWVSQKDFVDMTYLSHSSCLDTNLNNCFISFMEFQLKPQKDQIFILASLNIPPGLTFRCVSTDGLDFEFQVID